MLRKPLSWSVLLVLVFPAWLGQPAAAQAQPKGPISFINDVAPIFKENCFACHDAKKRKGKLDMTTYEAMRKGGDNEDPIAPGKPDDSNLMRLITSKRGDRMPPKEAGDPLPAEKIEIIKRWIAEGAKLDQGIEVKADLARELRARWKPPAPPASYKFPVSITALAFSPDSKKLVAGGQQELTVWDVASGKLEKRIYTRAERAYAMLFLPDGKLVVAGARPGQEGDVVVYDLNAKGKEEGGVTVLDGVNDKAVRIAKLLESDDSVLALALTKDGKKLASGGVDRLVHVWDISGGVDKAKLEQKIENHADWVFGVAFSKDGKLLLTASRDKTAKVWDLEKKESLLTFPGHQAPVYAVGISPDGKIGYSAGADKQIRYWNVTGDQKNLGKQVRASGGHGDEIFKMDVDGKDQTVASVSADKSVRLWNLGNGSAVKTMPGHTDWVYAVAFSPDGKYVASGAWNGELKIWNVADGKPVAEWNASPGLQNVVNTPAGETKK
ncbi:MAG: c-type cytochrome domain-containing protein [Gemmataceae bacterium]